MSHENLLQKWLKWLKKFAAAGAGEHEQASIIPRTCRKGCGFHLPCQEEKSGMDFAFRYQHAVAAEAESECLVRRGS